MKVESRLDRSIFLIANNTIVEYFYLLYLSQFGGKKHHFSSIKLVKIN